jgi:predicted ATPase
MITKIELTNFKSHAHTVIEPGRVTALVGPNGCGKTGVLQAIYCIGSLMNDRPFQVFTDRLSPDFLVRGHGEEFSINVEIGSDNLEVRLLTENPYVDRPRDWKFNVQGSFQNSPIGVGRGRLDQQPPLSTNLPSPLTRSLGPSEYFKAVSEKLASASAVEEYPPKLHSDGSGLASVIAHLILAEPERLQVIEDTLRDVVPTVRKVKARHTKMPDASKTGYEVIFDTASADAVPAHSMSEGTLLLLGMLTLLHSPNPPVIFLLEDVEQGLHPLAQRQLMQVLKGLAETKNLQIILASHSPYIIDELDAKDVWVMATDKEGISHTKRLSDHPEAERVLSVLSTGEFASAFDEDWVLGESQPAELVHG